MSNSISLEYLNSRIGNSNNGFTPEGGIYETFINNTGTSVKGTIVIASTTINNGVDIAPSNTQMPLGVIYENGISNGSLIKVITYGKAEVLLKNGENSSKGYWCGVSDVSGRMYQQNSPPGTTDHSREIGHSLESKTGGTNVLSLIQIHFN
jgi:hypothetical protein